MPRTKTPEGRRVGWSVKLSEPKSAAADKLRGGMTRARWLETLIDAAITAAAAQRLPGGSGGQAIPMPPVPTWPRREPESTPDVMTPPQRRRCTHPGTRVIGGYCKTCDHLIDPGGYWRE